MITTRPRRVAARCSPSIADGQRAGHVGLRAARDVHQRAQQPEQVQPAGARRVAAHPVGAQDVGADPVAGAGGEEADRGGRRHRQLAFLQLGGAEVHARAWRRPAARWSAPGRRRPRARAARSVRAVTAQSMNRTSSSPGRYSRLPASSLPGPGSRPRCCPCSRPSSRRVIVSSRRRSWRSASPSTGLAPDGAGPRGVSRWTVASRSRSLALMPPPDPGASRPAAARSWAAARLRRGVRRPTRRRCRRRPRRRRGPSGGR